MEAIAPLGIRRIEALHYYVRDLERSRRFYTEKLDFTEVGRSGTELVEGGRQQALVFEAGGCRIVCSSPVGEGGRADRFLKKHPDGIGSIVFEVEDVETPRGVWSCLDPRPLGGSTRRYRPDHA
jgi:4-hydroxyphenylpyruvate dioxygenase